MREQDNLIDDPLVISVSRLVAGFGFAPQTEIGENVVLVGRIAPHAMDTRIRLHIVGLGLFGPEQMRM